MNNTGAQPKFYNDFYDSSVIETLEQTSDLSDTPMQTVMSFEIINGVIEKLERVLSFREFKVVLIRLSIYHYRYPISAYDTPKESWIKNLSL